MCRSVFSYIRWRSCSFIYFQRIKATAEVKKELQRQLGEWIKEEETVKEIVMMTQDNMKKNSIPEHEVVVMVSTQCVIILVTSSTS